MSRLSRFLPKFLRGDKDKAANSAKSGDKSNCKIIFLDETEYFLPYKGGLKGQYILDKVYEQLNLFEKDYFGLRFIDQTGQPHWLDCTKSLSAQLKGCSLPYTLYFGVKFYPADPCKLKEEITRYQFFLQVKRDILHGRLPVTFEEAAEFFAYAVQSELGDFDSQQLPAGYVSEFQFVPNQTEELEDQITALHRRLCGTVPATAELKFLDKVKWLDMYGVDLHPVLGEMNTEYFLGLTPTGIVVYKNKTKVGNYFWPRITKVTFKAKVFIVKVKDKINDEHTYAFDLMTKPACKHLWKCCVEHHAFFRLNQLSDVSSRTSKPFRSTAKHRNSGRQDRQNNADQRARDQPRVLRVQSRRQARRAMSDTRLNQGDMVQSGIQYSEGHVTMVVTPEQVKGSRHRSLPDLKGRESPTSTRSAPWETNMDTGLYTSGRESPVSVTQSENVNYLRKQRAEHSDSESGYRRNRYRRGYDSDGGKTSQQQHHYHSNHSYGQLYSSRRSGYDSDSHSSVHRRKYFPSSRKGSDNESDVSFTRRKRREGDSGSESDISPKHAARQRKAKSVGADHFEKEWQAAMQNMYLPDKENRPNGSVPSIHSAPGGEARQKKMRRRRSKSPGNKRPPEELRQHIEFDLVDPGDVPEDQLREIPYVNIETKAEPFKVRYSPKTNRHRYRSPKRKSFGDLEPSNNKGGYTSEEPPPPYTRTPERTPEPAHKQMAKTGGYYSDTGSFAGSMSRNRPTPPSYSQQQYNNNNIGNVSVQSKPIGSNDDRGSVIDPASSNSTHETLHQHSDSRLLGAPDMNFDIQGYLNAEEGQGHDPDEDRNRDSGLNSSQGSNSTVMNTPPRSAQPSGRMFGTQDAIARLYSSPAGTRRMNNINSANQSPHLANQNVSYNQIKRTTNQNGFNNQQSPLLQNVSNSKSSSVSYNQPNSHSNSQQVYNSYGQQPQSSVGGYNRPSQTYNQAPRNSDYKSQTSRNTDHIEQTGLYGQQSQNGYVNHSSPNNTYYSQSNSMSHFTSSSSHDNYVSQNSSYSNNNNVSAKTNTYGGKSRYAPPRSYPNSSSQNKYYGQSDNQESSQHQSAGGMKPIAETNWQYMGNGDVSSTPSQGAYVPSSHTQKSIIKTGSSSPYSTSPAVSPVKKNGLSRHIPLSPVQDNRQTTTSSHGINKSMKSSTSLNFKSPDSAISSLSSMSINNNHRQNSGANISQNSFHSQNGGTLKHAESPQRNQIDNFSRVRTPAFGRSDVWTEL